MTHRATAGLYDVFLVICKRYELLKTEAVPIRGHDLENGMLAGFQTPHHSQLGSVALVLVAQSFLTLCDPMDCTIHHILQARIPEWAAFPFPRGSSQPRDQTQVSHTAHRFFTSWATGKPKNTGMGSLSLLQQIFLTQELRRKCLYVCLFMYIVCLYS